MLVSLSVIKNKLDDHIGQSVLVTAQAGRRKVTERRGILRETYPAVFVVELEGETAKFDRVSYSYTDILTENIAVDFE